MDSEARLPAIPGVALDPPPVSVVAMTERIESRSRTAALGYRISVRFTMAHVTLLAAGTTYYLFLSLFALITLAFGVAALLGAQQIVTLVNNALENFLPGLVGANGINPAALESLGAGTSLGGLAVLAYSAGGAILATSRSLHTIYGAPPDGRNFLLARLRLIGWMLVIAPLIVLSFTPLVVLSFFTEPIDRFLGIKTPTGHSLLQFGAYGLSLALNFLIIYLMLSRLGGLKPSRRPRIVGATLGAVGIELLKALMSRIVSWSVSKPQYGAFATPITILLILYLQTMVLYGCACVVAALAERDAENAAARTAVG
ncbi:MAG: YihY/virulence factor BrkB family protein [Candidatus Nanopelagicales bacterium]